MALPRVIVPLVAHLGRLRTSLSLGEMRGCIGAAGSWVRELTLVTTLTDPAVWTKDEI